jgi:hypothetical protein
MLEAWEGGEGGEGAVWLERRGALSAIIPMEIAPRMKGTYPRSTSMEIGPKKLERRELISYLL